MHQLSFGGRAPARGSGRAYSAPPDPLDGLRGPTSKGRRGERKGEGRAGKGQEGREREEEKGRGRGREGGSLHITCLHDAPGRMFAVDVQSVSVQHLN